MSNRIMYYIKKLSVYLICVMIFIFVLALFLNKFYFYTINPSVGDMTLKINKSTDMPYKYSLLWFDFNGDTVNLNLSYMLDSNNITLLNLTHSGDVESFTTQSINQEIPLNSNLSGTFGAVFSPFIKDIDNDGIYETINLSTKADTLFTRGFYPVKTTFLNEQMPLEIYYVGNKNIQILLNQNPLANQELYLTTYKTSNQKVVTDQAGFIKLKDIRELRKGIHVLYLGSNNTYNISSYILESNTLFSTRHKEAFTPVFYILSICTILIITIVFIRTFLFKTSNRSQAFVTISND